MISIHYPANSNENTQTYQVEVVVLIKHQILVTNLQGSLQQLEGRINDQTLGFKGYTNEVKI